MRTVGRMLGVLAVLWVVLVAALAIVMRQPPAVFGRIMAHVPGPMFLVLPFETLWLNARAGALNTNDPAPGFSLATRDHTSHVNLADLRGRPVVLVFGSYT